jgi:hypothetical protein
VRRPHNRRPHFQPVAGRDLLDCPRRLLPRVHFTNGGAGGKYDSRFEKLTAIHFVLRGDP